MAQLEVAAQFWESMKQTVRREAESLVDDSPDFPTMTVSAPVLAEQFCEIEPPTDLQAVLMRQIAMSSVAGGFHRTRDQLLLSRRLSSRIGCP